MGSYYDQKPWLKTFPQWLPSELTVPDHSILDAFLDAFLDYFQVFPGCVSGLFPTCLRARPRKVSAGTWCLQGTRVLHGAGLAVSIKNTF